MPGSIQTIHEIGGLQFLKVEREEVFVSVQGLHQTSVQGIQDGWLARDRFFFCGWIDEIMGKDAFFFEEFGKTLGVVE